MLHMLSSISAPFTHPDFLYCQCFYYLSFSKWLVILHFANRLSQKKLSKNLLYYYNNVNIIT